MATDVELGLNAVWLIAKPETPGVLGRVTCWATLLELDAGPATRMNQGGMRRALAHVGNDVLVVNLGEDQTGGGDYTGGVEIRGIAGVSVLGALKVAGATSLSHPVWLQSNDGTPLEIPSLESASVSPDSVEKTELLYEIQVLRQAVAKLSDRVKKLEKN